MKQLQYITAFSLIVALTGLSPVVAEDAGRTSGGERTQLDPPRFESPLGYILSPEQMDKVHGGMINPYEYDDPRRMAGANVVVEEVKGHPGYYTSKFFLRPHYQLEGL